VKVVTCVLVLQLPDQLPDLRNVFQVEDQKQNVTATPKRWKRSYAAVAAAAVRCRVGARAGENNNNSVALLVAITHSCLSSIELTFNYRFNNHTVFSVARLVIT